MAKENKIFNEAVRHCRNGEMSEAESLYRQVLDEEPGHPEANHDLGKLLLAQGKVDMAAVFLKKAVDASPGNPVYLKSYTSFLLGNNQFEDALEVFHEIEGLGLPGETLKELRMLSVEKKVLSQSDIPVFFDNYVYDNAVEAIDPESGLVFAQFLDLLDSKKNRFVSFDARVQGASPGLANDRDMPNMSLVFSQGTHSLLKWKGYPLFKSAFDLSIYWMLINELKPDVIIELGSGPGGSAVRLSDISKAFGLNAKVLSYDIARPVFDYPNVEFLEFDLCAIKNSASFSRNESWTGVKLVIEDAHVNVLDVLREIDNYLTAGDYLVVEDSDNKQEILLEFLSAAKNIYLTDQYFLDFFGRNGTSARNSIFRVQGR